MNFIRRKSGLEDALQKTYDEAYELSLDAIILETRNQPDAALKSWMTTLECVLRNLNNIAAAPRTDNERTLLASILDVERQCRDRISFLDRPLHSASHSPYTQAASTYNGSSKYSTSHASHDTYIMHTPRASFNTPYNIYSNENDSNLVANHPLPMPTLPNGGSSNSTSRTSSKESIVPSTSPKRGLVKTLRTGKAQKVTSNRPAPASASLAATSAWDAIPRELEARSLSMGSNTSSGFEKYSLRKNSKEGFGKVHVEIANERPKLNTIRSGSVTKENHQNQSTSLSSNPATNSSHRHHHNKSAPLLGTQKYELPLIDLGQAIDVANPFSTIGPAVNPNSISPKPRPPVPRKPVPLSAGHSLKLPILQTAQTQTQPQQTQSQSSQAKSNSLKTESLKDSLSQALLAAVETPKIPGKTPSPLQSTVPKSRQLPAPVESKSTQASTPTAVTKAGVKKYIVVHHGPEKATERVARQPVNRVQPKETELKAATLAVKARTAKPICEPQPPITITVGDEKTKPKSKAEDEESNPKTKEEKEWEKRCKTALKNLRGVDEASAQQILNEIVLKGDEVHWDDIAGLEQAKMSLKETVVYPFLRPDLFSGLREPARGMLLFGPPGTGKTMLARAVATESKSTFFSISASSLMSKYLGESEKLVRALFQLAKELAPSIIFVDEIDSLLSTRSSNGEQESSRRIKNEFLVQWSDLQHAAAGKEQEDVQRVLVLAATNLPWSIDEAARRRFVRRQYIPLSERETRHSHLQKLLSNQKHAITDEEFERLLDLTDGFSGSDITALAKDAAMGPLRSLGEALLTTTFDQIRPVGFEDFVASLKTIRPSVSKEGLLEFEKWAALYGSSGA